MEKTTSSRRGSKQSASWVNSVAGAKANIWITTAAVLAIMLVVMVLLAAPVLPVMQSLADSFVKGKGGAISLGLPGGSATSATDASFDFRTDIQTDSLPEWSESICPGTRGTLPPKGTRPQTRPKVVVQLDRDDANNLSVGQVVKFKVYYYDCGWQLGNTFANWRDNSVYLDGFTKTASPLGDGELIVPENYYEQQGPYMFPGSQSWWSVSHVFNKPGTFPIRFRIRNGGNPGGSTVVTFPVTVKGSGTPVVCNDSAKVTAGLDSTSPTSPTFGAPGSQAVTDVGHFKITATKGNSTVNTLYIAVEGKDGAPSGIDSSYEAGVFSKFAVTTSTGQEIGAAGGGPLVYYQDKDQIIPDFDRLLRAGIVQWGGVINASVSQKKQVALYPIRLNSALVIPEGQAVVVTLKMTKNYRFESSAQADGWRFGVARVECGFGLNMIEGGSKYSTTAFTPFVTTPGFTQTCPYRPPHPMSITGGCYEWQDMPTCAWKTTDCSSASGGGASVTH